MDKSVLIIFLLLVSNGFSQSIIYIVKDSKGQQEPVDFVKMTIDDEIYYSDVDGKVLTKDVIKTCEDIDLDDFIVKTKSCLVKNGSVIIVVEEKVNELTAVEITSTEKRVIKKRKRSKIYRNILILPKSELISKLEINNANEILLNKISFDIDKTHGIDFKSDSINGVLKINLYKQKQNKLVKEFQSKGIYFKYDEKETLNFEFPDSTPFFGNTLFLGIEYVGTINKDGKFIDQEYYLRPLVSNMRSKEFNIISFMAIAPNRELSNFIDIKTIEEKMAIPVKKRGRSLNFELKFVSK